VTVGKEDLSKLKIEKSAKVFRPKSRKKWIYLILVVVCLAIAGILYFNGWLSPAIPIEV